MASVPATGPISGTSKQPKPEDAAEPTQPPSNTRDTELQLVSSLAKLQKLEATIHHLRTLLPTRLLAPLAPIVQPKKGPGAERSHPASPGVLYEQLSRSARSGVEEIRRFQGVWRSPEMRGVWERVEADIAGLGGLLQPTGVWEVDYEERLEGLVKEERAKNEQAQMEEEERERERLRSTGCDWRRVVESFAARTVPGVRVVPGENDHDPSLTVALVKAGMVFQVHAAAALEGGDVPDWRVATKVSPGRPVTKLETGVADCLNSRGRQWDLGFLLDMMSSYADIKQTPCKKCARMTDSSALLPSVRKSTAAVSAEGNRSVSFEPYHPGCI